MSIAIKNICERIWTFSDCLRPHDDSSTITIVDREIICSNCGEICGKKSFFGKSPVSKDRNTSFAYLCFGCTRAFQHCARRKDICNFLTCFQDCFRNGFKNKATSGMHNDYKNISPLPKIKCFNCGRRCKQEYFHGLQNLPYSPMYTFSTDGKLIIDNLYADICIDCCRAFYVGQAVLFPNDSLAFHFKQLSMKPELCLTKKDFVTQYFEAIWYSLQLKEWTAGLTLAKTVPKKIITKRKLSIKSF